MSEISPPTELLDDLVDTAAALREGRTTSESLTQACLDRISALNDELCSVVAVYGDSALATAQAADAERGHRDDLSPLHGIPVAVKDVIATQEGPTRAGGHAWSDDWHRHDGTAVGALRAAGAVVIGKSLTMEFAVGMPDRADGTPVSRNAWNTAAWAGGSSSGTGTGIAAGLFLAGLGTDTGGSIRCPASYCGVTGLKPTYGLVPVDGMIPWAYSLDHLGPLARSARDCAAVLDAIAGPQAPRSRPRSDLRGVRVGVDRVHHLTADVVDPAVVRSFEAALATLVELGATVVEIDLPLYLEVANAAMLITPAEGYAVHRENLQANWHRYGSQTRVQIAAGAVIGAADYVQAQRVAELARTRLATLMADLDVIAVPTTATPAPAVEELYGQDLRRLIVDTIYTPYWDVLGNPAVSLPMGFTDSGMPLGLQLIGRPWRDFDLLGVGGLWQQVTTWHRRRAPGVIAPTAGVGA